MTHRGADDMQASTAVSNIHPGDLRCGRDVHIVKMIILSQWLTHLLNLKIKAEHKTHLRIIHFHMSNHSNT